MRKRAFSSLISCIVLLAGVFTTCYGVNFLKTVCIKTTIVCASSFIIHYLESYTPHGRLKQKIMKAEFTYQQERMAQQKREKFFKDQYTSLQFEEARLKKDREALEVLSKNLECLNKSKVMFTPEEYAEKEHLLKNQIQASFNNVISLNTGQETRIRMLP